MASKIRNGISHVWLENKVVLVTGGYGHLGRCIAENLASHGGRVYVLGRSKEKFSNSVDSRFENIFFNYCDISTSESIAESISQIVKIEKKVDALINNAFYIKGKDPETMSNEDWEFGMDGSLTSVFRAMKEVIPYFKHQRFGKIINVASMYGMIAPDFDVYNDFPSFVNPPHYGAAKAGVIQLTKYYASFLGQFNINVNSVSPGPFPSNEIQKRYPVFIDTLAKKTVLNRIGQPEELGGMFTFLVSDAASYITGQNFTIDGGWTIKS